MRKIIVFGALDTSLSMQCDHFPKPGEVITGSGYMSAPSGKGGNQAVCAARMGAETFMVGKVGNDHNGRKITADLTKHGVSVMNVSVTARARTGVSLVVNAGRDFAVVVDPGANDVISYEEVRAAIHGLGEHRNIFLTSLSCDFDVTMQALACAKRNSLFTILHAAPSHELPDEAYKGLDLLVVNKDNCRLLSGIDPATDDACRQALAFFAGKGVRQTVITLDKRGSVTLVGGNLFKVPGYDVDIVDASCGGDAYVGELAAHIAFDGPIEESMQYATAAAAISIGRAGAQKSLPSWAEVEDFVKEHGMLGANA